MPILAGGPRDVPVLDAPERGGLTFSSRVVWFGILAYACGITALAVAGVYVFIVKTLICPLIVLVGIQIAGARTFARDWAAPFAMVTLFDAGRAWVYAVVIHFRLPIYMQYAIDWERAWFGTVLPLAWQQALRHPVLDGIALIFHGTHFGYFLLFGFVVWWFDRLQFQRWARGLGLVIVGGLIVYLIIPTVPPWMAAQPDFGALPPLEHVIRTAYTHKAPVLLEGFDVNIIAAMPSLHVAFPAYCAFVGWAIGGRRIGLLLSTYTLIVTLSVIYLGQHYGVDAVAGVALAYVGFRFGFQGPAPAKNESPYRTAGWFLTASVLAAVSAGLLLWR